VVVTATDDLAVAAGSLNVRSDLDGSGAIDTTGERLVGTATGNPNEFTVTSLLSRFARRRRSIGKRDIAGSGDGL